MKVAIRSASLFRALSAAGQLPAAGENRTVRFGILGTTQVWRDDGGEVDVGGPTRRALLALLLVRPGDVVPAGVLVDDLYDVSSGSGHALQSQVSRLRLALRPEAAIELVSGGYRLAAEPDDVDAGRFQRLADEGRRALHQGDPRQAADLLRAALALWRGPALADAAEAASVQAEIVRLEERRLGALEDRIEADLQRGEHRAAVPELQELVDRHPLRERLRGLLMRALQADGRQAEALVTYEEVRRLLADELGADPSAELIAIHRALLVGERLFAAPALPAQLTSFVGRAEDLAKVGDLLGSARLITLLGPGGAGKTRLSIELASRRPEVCFVELAPLREAAELPHAVLNALGLRDGGLNPAPETADVTARLVAALADRSLLLVLDNCEHLVAPAAALAARLLAGCPALRMLATSREPLGITGETLWPVRPLEPAPAVRLFADRAAAVRPGFQVTDEVGRICAALDGLPLAIELAAARLRTLDVADLAARLDDRFRLLSRGSRTAEARHQTLRAVVAWSWDLLAEPEQAMARRLTVFTGGATASAAGEVCGMPDVSEDLLDSLVDKSLVEVAGGRYRMLETIHAYCAEQLDLAGEAADLRRAHAGYFLARAETADPHLRRAEQLDWLATLVAEHENLHAALRWAVEAGEVTVALRLLAAMASYLWMRGARTTTTAQAVALLDLIGSDPPAGLTDEYVLTALIAAASAGGRAAWDRHRATAEATVLATQGRDRHPVITFFWLMVNASATEPAAALSLIRQSRESKDPWERASVHLMWGYPQLATADFASAEREFMAAADAFRALGDRWGTALALDALAEMAELFGDNAKAITLVDEALDLTEQLGAAEDLPDLLCNRGDYRLRRDDRDGARADYERAAEIARRVGSTTYLAGALRGLGDLALTDGDLAEARRLYEHALERFEPHWMRSIGNRIGVLIGLGRVAAASGELAEARDRYRQAVEVALAGPITLSARAIEALAGVTLAEGDPAEAARLLGAATALRGIKLDDDPEVAGTAAAIRAALGDDGYEAAYRAGLRLPLDDALRLTGASEQLIQSSPIHLELPDLR
jgi:predicted ATPase/DNA-binding SARP family transcriptional activator/predicted negative regulator of RcsB-dependent stress response